MDGIDAPEPRPAIDVQPCPAQDGSTMTVLAIDPGYEQSAWVILKDGIPKRSGISPNQHYLSSLTMSDEHYDHAVIEAVACYGMAVGKEVFETVFWTGRFYEAIYQKMGIRVGVHRMYRKEIKMHLCGNNAAKDANIRQALIDKFGPGKEKAIGKKHSQGPLYGISKDMWAALAVGVTWIEKNATQIPLRKLAGLE